MPKPQKVPAIAYEASNVWSAAAAAFRVNQGYVKDPLYDFNVETGEKALLKDANKRLVNAMLLISAGWNEDDVAVGQTAREYWQQSGLMKLLKDDKLSDFDKAAQKASEKETIDSFLDIAIISSLIAGAKRGMERDRIDSEKRFSSSEWLGKSNEKITLDSLIVQSCVYSVNYGSYRCEGTQNGNYVSWWGKVKLEAGQVLNVTARIKACVLDKASGAKVTQVNYIKAAK